MIRTQMSYYYLCAKHYKTEEYHCNKSSKEFLPFDNQGDYKEFKLICLNKKHAETYQGFFQTGEAAILKAELQTTNYILHTKDTQPTRYANQPVSLTKF
jgi:hypothetical protein